MRSAANRARHRFAHRAERPAAGAHKDVLGTSIKVTVKGTFAGANETKGKATFASVKCTATIRYVATRAGGG